MFSKWHKNVLTKFSLLSKSQSLDENINSLRTLPQIFHAYANIQIHTNASFFQCAFLYLQLTGQLWASFLTGIPSHHLLPSSVMVICTGAPSLLNPSSWWALCLFSMCCYYQGCCWERLTEWRLGTQSSVLTVTLWSHLSRRRWAHGALEEQVKDHSCPALDPQTGLPVL